MTVISYCDEFDTGGAIDVKQFILDQREEDRKLGALIRKSASYKYNEMKHAREIYEHVASTYQGHYVGEGGVQSLDLIFATGHGVGFCIGSALKYLARFGKKEGYNRNDMLKAAHYIILALHAHDRDAEPEEKK